MTKNYFITLTTVLTFILLQFSCAPTRKFHCQDGETITPYKDPAESFPVYTKQFDHSINTTLDILDTAKLTANITLKNKVIEFREKLNQTSSIIQDLIKQNVISYNNGMCYYDVRETFQKFQTYLADKIFQINKTNEDLKKININSKEGEEKIIKDIQEIDTHVQSIQKMYNNLYPSDDVMTTPKLPIKLFIKYHDNYTDNSNLLFNSIIKVLNADKNVKFEYFFKESDLSKADFQIIMSYNGLKTSTKYLADCNYIYNFSLFTKNDKSGEFVAISTEQLQTDYCSELNREADIGDKFKGISKPLVQIMSKKSLAQSN